MFSGLLEKDLFKGGWSTAEKLFKQNYCHACHTKFAVFFPLPSCCVSSLIIMWDDRDDSGPASYLLALLAIFLANSSPSSSGWNEWIEVFRHFLVTSSSLLPKQLNLVPRSSKVESSTIWQFCCTIDVIFHITISRKLNVLLKAFCIRKLHTWKISVSFTCPSGMWDIFTWFLPEGADISHILSFQINNPCIFPSIFHCLNL